MRNDREEPLDPSRPALIVTYGFTPRRVRPLDGDLVLVGRGRACDLGLTSPEVAELHCVLVRTGGGWRLRDCGSRLGTRVNGQPVQETPLGDGDVIQVGNFNFRLHLPEPSPTGAVAPPREAVAANSGDVERSLGVLRERMRECEQKTEQLSQEERELAQDRAALDGEYAALQRRTDEAEQALARRQGEVEADLRRRWQECDARCRERERQQAEGARPAAAGAADAEEARRLELRRRELDRYAAHLRRSGQRLADRQRAEAEEVQELRARLDAARRAIQEKELQIQQLLAQQQPADADRGRHEAELAAFRRQLQEDRRGLNQEIRELRARTRALEDAARATEEQMVQERAEQAHGEGGQPAAPGRLTGTHRLKATMARMIGPLPGGSSTAQRDKPASKSRLPRVRLPRRGEG